MANRTVSVILQAEIGNYVSNMTKAAAATKGLGETAETSTAKANKGFDLAGKGAMLAGAAVAGALVGVITKSMEFEKSMSAVQAATQASAATMGDLRAAAIKAGADTQYSATEAADAITEMAKAGVSAKDIMKGGLTGALSLAAAGQLSVADAAGIASTAMTQFSLSGDKIPHVADLLAAGAGKAMGSVDDLGQALNQAGLLASSTGISIEETTGTLAAFASAGLVGSDAGTSFKTMLQQLQNPSQQSAALMQQLGINAYDAQGNFIGLAALAQQLKDHLGGLTQAQRDQALAQIFGTDAARAATVLYREGAAGIDDWTKKVNDSGYAQRQAAQLTDNLAGDLERLGGSFDTLLISIGQGLQGPLRGLTQMLGGLVDGAGNAVKMFGELPGPVQLAIGAFGAWAVAGDKIKSMFAPLGDSVSGFFQTFSEALGYARENGDGLSEVLGSVGETAWDAAKGGLKELAKAIGPELGAAAATYVVSHLVSEFVDVAHIGDDARKTVDALRDSLKGLNNSGRFDALTAGISELQSKLAEARATAAQDANQNWFQKYVFQNPFDESNVTAAANASASVKQYEKALADLEARQKTAGEAVDMLSGRLGLSKDQVIQLADKYGVDLSGSLDTVYGRFLVARASQDGMAGSSDNAASAAGAFKTQMDGVAQAAQDAKDQTDQFKLSLDILTGKQVDLNEVESAYYAALDAAKGALDGLNGRVVDHAGNLDLSTEAGRKTNDVLKNLRDTSNQYLSTLINQGMSAEDAQAKDAELRKSFYDTALQMTGSKDAAQKLTDQIYGIPDQRTTKINADVDEAQRKLADTQTQIDGLHGKDITIRVNADHTAGVIIGNPSAVGPGTRGWAVQYADGGYTGPGGKYQPAGIVHAGEFVFPQESVNRLGVGFLGSLAGLPGYSGGGPVGPAFITANIDGSPLDQTLKQVAAGLSQQMSVGGAGGAARWAGVVLQALAMMGQSPALLGSVLRRMNQESGGNPFAINNWDINAQRGDPSRGLMQTIGSTFRAYHDPRTSWDIYDPLANVLASMHYALARYGSLAAAYNRMGGYETGTDYVPTTGPAILHQGEAVLTKEENAARFRSREMAGVGAGGGGSVSVAPPIVKVFLDGEEWRGMARVEAEGIVLDSMTGQARRLAY